MDHIILTGVTGHTATFMITAAIGWMGTFIRAERMKGHIHLLGWDVGNSQHPLKSHSHRYRVLVEPTRVIDRPANAAAGRVAPVLSSWAIGRVAPPRATASWPSSALTIWTPE